MKILKYKQILCEGCRGRREIDIAIKSHKNYHNPQLPLARKEMNCPLCDGKGHLRILITENE
jgi:hypothetical protein